MTNETSIALRKMNGLGNDFAVLDARPNALALSAGQARAIANRETGVGCDQVIALEPSGSADVFMRIWNHDGGEVEACGNAARCVASVLAGETGRSNVTIETQVAVLGATINTDGTVTIDMGVPLFRWDQIPLSEEFERSHIPQDLGARRRADPRLRYSGLRGYGGRRPKESHGQKNYRRLAWRAVADGMARKRRSHPHDGTERA